MVSENDVDAMLEDEKRLSPHDLVNIQFTSGTTGFPKGAALTHFNIVNNGRFTGAAQHLTSSDRMCIPVPLCQLTVAFLAGSGCHRLCAADHCFGMVMGALACIAHGATSVFPSEAFDAEAAVRVAAAERCTSLYGRFARRCARWLSVEVLFLSAGVPTMFIAMLAVRCPPKP
jgi:fatty-acyl-CoA synthase